MMLLDQARQQFQSVFKRTARVAVQSPGRINLIGEHIDYLDGWVMPAAIDRNLLAVAAPIDEPVVRMWTERLGGVPQQFGLDDMLPRKSDADTWLNYVIGVLAGYRDAGVDLPGFEIVLLSDLPSGAGLSSSAALETVTALTVEALTGIAQDPVDRALICQKAEHDYAGVPCGIMDQLAVGVSQAGRALRIDCRDLTFESVALPDDCALVVADTGVKHTLGDGEYRKRREECEQATAHLDVESLRYASLDRLCAQRDILGDRLFRRARHAVTEMERVHEFSTALEKNDLDAVGRLMRAGHDSIRDDFEVSCDELDSLVDAAYDFGQDRGLLGARMTGGGFGGSTVNLVRRDAAGNLIEHLQQAYAKRYDRPLQAFETTASAAAQIISTSL